MRLIREIPTEQSLKAKYALTKDLLQIREQRFGELRQLLSGANDRLLLLIGPCSADCEDAVLEYCTRLARLQDEVKDRLLLVPRIFTAKPRRLGDAYKGLIHSPVVGAKEDMAMGIEASRQMHFMVARQTGLFAATEMLYPELIGYFSDLVAYWVIGSRSVENQQHKLVASGVEHPVGLKNPMNGNLDSLVSAVRFVEQQHHFLLNGNEYESDGNKQAHCILRGYVDANGVAHNNYGEQTVEQLAKEQMRIIIDCNHHNSNKQYAEQPSIALQVVDYCKNNMLRSTVKGLMIESYLQEGKQTVGGKCFGQSITDGCLGWQQTEALVKELAYKW